MQHILKDIVGVSAIQSWEKNYGNSEWTSLKSQIKEAMEWKRVHIEESTRENCYWEGLGTDNSMSPKIPRLGLIDSTTYYIKEKH